MFFFFDVIYRLMHTFFKYFPLVWHASVRDRLQTFTYFVALGCASIYWSDFIERVSYCKFFVPLSFYLVFIRSINTCDGQHMYWLQFWPCLNWNRSSIWCWQLKNGYLTTICFWRKRWFSDVVGKILLRGITDFDHLVCSFALISCFFERWVVCKLHDFSFEDITTLWPLHGFSCVNCTIWFATCACQLCQFINCFLARPLRHFWCFLRVALMPVVTWAIYMEVSHYFIGASRLELTCRDSFINRWGIWNLGRCVFLESLEGLTNIRHIWRRLDWFFVHALFSRNWSTTLF